VYHMWYKKRENMLTLFCYSRSCSRSS